MLPLPGLGSTAPGYCFHCTGHSDESIVPYGSKPLLYANLLELPLGPFQKMEVQVDHGSGGTLSQGLQPGLNRGAYHHRGRPGGSICGHGGASCPPRKCPTIKPPAPEVSKAFRAFKTNMTLVMKTDPAGSGHENGPCWLCSTCHFVWGGRTPFHPDY